ncbi:HAD family hydrolase [Alteromonas sp. ASW11-36]|uniref:HAD family hydrolase n=1 Tax=Alteromonas arenosi TaxID=3055817 RepID=A0ABT7SSC4_9ALTE|nr:HAD family hydrolase [Alteromonas sp. ASW11-36]MDM7859087.1 HAD family hydrolase [Alteromonas sp. ASW11-36]
MTKRIAMWSGPRNISTAMMRSFENRPDCTVLDEPFYAYYLSQTQSPHPMFDEVVASQPVDYAEVAEAMSSGHCLSPLQYQKQMTHHMLPGCDLTWTVNLQHCFLIRDPAEVINSYTNARGICTSDDIGIIRQFELYETISALSGQNIPVVDCKDVLQNPQVMLPKICQALGIAFEPNMLAWPQGRRDSDGVWAEHWYASVEQSTGFSPRVVAEVTLNNVQRSLAVKLQPYYEKLKAKAISMN